MYASCNICNRVVNRFLLQTLQLALHCPVMSRFIRELEELLTEHKISSGSKVFEIAGLDKSMLSRIRAGVRRIQFIEIPRVAAAIGADDMVFLRLFRARLLEECMDCPDNRAKRIKIEIAGSSQSRPLEMREFGQDFLAKLPPDHELALRNIAANLKYDTGLRKTILWLGEVAQRKMVANSDPSSTGIPGISGTHPKAQPRNDRKRRVAKLHKPDAAQPPNAPWQGGATGPQSKSQKKL